MRVVTPYVGGGFGGKSAGSQAVEAALLSAAARRPVQVAFSRAEEFFYDTFGPACVVRIASALGRDGQVRVARIVCAQDVGIVVNPTGATMQIEGALTMGLGYALTEELRFRGGESAITVAGAVIANAVFDATGCGTSGCRSRARGCSPAIDATTALGAAPRFGDYRAVPLSRLAAASSSTACCTAR